VVNTLIASGSYFDTLGIRILRGRNLDARDRADGRPVILVNETLARRYFSGTDPIGRRVGTGFDGLKPVREIVGIVADAHDRGLKAEPIPTVYIPFEQFSLPYGAMAVRSSSAVEGIASTIRERIQHINPSVPLADFQTLEERLTESLREPRFYTVIAGACAVMAMLFVTFGLYGLISYSVSRRTAELGLRLAIGAQPQTILTLVLSQGLRLAFAGIVLGLALAFVSTRLLRSLLFEVDAHDPLTFGAAVSVTLLVTLLAVYGPARRASRVDPLVALRYE
jgi:putative ABC transport system permease protein